MRFRGTVLLAVVLVFLCAGYWWMQRREVERVREAVEARRLFDFTAEDVVRLRIAQLGKTPAAGVRNDGGWEIVEPGPGITPYAPLWDRVAGRLAELRNERTLLERAEDLDQYGLAEPVLTVSAELASGAGVELAFGTLEPMRVCRYALYQNEIFLVHKDMFYELNRSLKDLRNQFLVDHREADVLRMEFARIWTGNSPEAAKMEAPPEVGSESVRVVVERASAEEPWRMVAPVDAPADQERVSALVSEVQYGTAMRFIDDF